MRILAIGKSRHRSASVWSKWMSAAIGMETLRESSPTASAAAGSGTAKRTRSQPSPARSVSSEAASSRSADLSARFHMVWTETGNPPPMMRLPAFTARLARGDLLAVTPACSAPC